MTRCLNKIPFLTRKQQYYSHVKLKNSYYKKNIYVKVTFKQKLYDTGFGVSFCAFAGDNRSFGNSGDYVN